MAWSRDLAYSSRRISALALSGAEVLRVAYEPSQIKQNAWAQAHEDYLQINAFPDLIVVER